MSDDDVSDRDQAVLEEDRAHLAGCRVVASVSGGKDSAALSLWLTEQGIEHDRIFADTGWEHETTYEYLHGELTRVIGPITVVRGERLMPELIRHKGMFPGRKARFCTELLKVAPIKAYLEGLPCDAVNAVGIRAAESEARKHLTRWEEWPAGDCMVWRPLIAWTEADVIAIHHRHGLRPNPLYLKGAGRVGCWPCLFASKVEIRRVAEMSPARIDEIRALEVEVGDKQEARCAERGTTIAAEGRNRATFFARSHRPRPVVYVEGSTTVVDEAATAAAVAAWQADGGNMLPIDEAVAWSKTARGGKQLLLLDPEPPGCMRWGLCETADAAE